MVLGSPSSLSVASCLLVLGTHLLGTFWSFPGFRMFWVATCLRMDQDPCLSLGGCGRNLDRVISPLGAWPLNLILVGSEGCLTPVVDSPCSPGLLLFFCCPQTWWTQVIGAGHGRVRAQECLLHMPGAAPEGAPCGFASF